MERARADVRAGEPWRARDRLQGVLKNDPANQEALELLGDVFYEMGDRPQAGRFWMLTGRDDERAVEAREAFERAYPALQDRLRAVPAREPVAAYPAPARDRLAALQADATRAGIDWKVRDAPRRPRGKRDGEDVADWKGMFAVAVVLAATLGVWIVGLVAIVIVLVSLVD